MSESSMNWMDVEGDESVAAAQSEALKLVRAANATTPAGAGCPFAGRCAQRIAPCLSSDPEPRPHDHRLVRCHLYPASAPGRSEMKE